MLYHNVTVFTVYLLYIYFTIIIIINFIYYKIIKNIYIYNSQITNKDNKIK